MWLKIISLTTSFILTNIHEKYPQVHYPQICITYAFFQSQNKTVTLTNSLLDPIHHLRFPSIFPSSLPVFHTRLSLLLHYHPSLYSFIALFSCFYLVFSFKYSLLSSLYISLKFPPKPSSIFLLLSSIIYFILPIFPIPFVLSLLVERSSHMLSPLV